jgi:integrase
MGVIYKTLPKRHKTKKVGIYYKEIEKTVTDNNGNSKVTILKDDRVYSIQYKDIDDKWKFKTIGKFSEGIREAYCLSKRNEILNKVRLGEQPEIIKKRVKKEIITLDQIFKLYNEQKKSENKSLLKCGQMYMVYIFKRFGNQDINTITTEDIVKFKQDLLDKNLAGSTINGNITFIGTLFNLAIDDKLYEKSNPVKSKKLKAIKLDNARDRYLSTKEVQELFDAIRQNDILTMFVKLSLTTGGRLETILNIQKKDINLENGTITLKDLKTNTTYTGFLSEDLHEQLEKIYEQLKPNSYIVGGELIKFATRTLQRHLKYILDDLFNEGLDTKDAKNRTVIHTLRHTFASHLAINGIPIFTIQKLMNHSDIKMTMRYAKLAPDSGKVAIQGLYK